MVHVFSIVIHTIGSKKFLPLQIKNIGLLARTAENEFD
jgi:hypothetical protein